MDGLHRHLVTWAAQLSDDDGTSDRRLDDFLDDGDIASALVRWLGTRLAGPGGQNRAVLKSWLTAEIARIDDALNEQLNAVLHHTRLQRLEASWRGLAYLVGSKPDTEMVRIRVLDVRWQELSADAEGAIEFDQTELFRRVYEEEFGMPGGNPYGLLLADFAIQHRPSDEHPVDDVRTLRALAQVASAAFAPLIISADSRLFGFESFQGISRLPNLDRLFAEHEYIEWRDFRSSEDARFVGVVLPRVLMRRPYRTCTDRNDQFPFEEQVRANHHENYVWGNAVYAFGAVAMRSFGATGWFEDVLGVREDTLGGGLVNGLAVDEHGTDLDNSAPKISVDVLVADELEADLSRLGFIPLVPCKYTRYAAFFNAPALQQPQRYVQAGPMRNAELSTKLPLMMCVARFAHCIKVMVRDQTARFTSAEEVKANLHRWIQQFVSADNALSPRLRGRFPLREAQITVLDVAGRPGVLMCICHLKPHVQRDGLLASFKLVTELPVFPPTDPMVDTLARAV